MIRLAFAIPGDIDTPTGGYSYDRRIMALLPDFGIDVSHLALPGGFPFPSEAEIYETARWLAGVPSDIPLLIDGLAFGAMPEQSVAAIAAPIVVLLHHPLGLETGLSDAQSRALLASEQAALKFARHVVVTSATTAETLRELGFAPPPPVTIAEPGTERVPRAAGGGRTCEILSVGTIIPRKGYDVLIDALAMIAHLDWHSTIAGGLDRDAAFAAKIIRRIADAGLQTRVTLTGALDAAALEARYAKADLFALPSRYEGYGMAFAAALARGLPVVAARAGAVPGTVPADAGILVPPDDAAALSDALAHLIGDRALRRKLSDAAWAHGQTLPRWEDTARIVADVVREVMQ